jgi:macrodomain Ter protein organizer (MatP/YcbG family)
MAANEHKRKNFLNAETQSTRRSAKEIDLIFSANLCALRVSALKPASTK